MSRDRSEKPPVDRLATGIRMATVVVVLGTLVAIWHPGMHDVATTLVGPVTQSAPGTPDAAGSDDTTYFPSRFAAPENAEPESPSF